MDSMTVKGGLEIFNLFSVTSSFHLELQGLRFRFTQLLFTSLHAPNPTEPACQFYFVAEDSKASVSLYH
jgi:hypothetical protein